MFNDNDNSLGGLLMLEPATFTIAQDFEAPAPALGPKIAANMCGVDLILRRPSGKYKIQGAEVMAADEAGNQEKMDNKKITRRPLSRTPRTTIRSGNRLIPTPRSSTAC